MRYLFNRLGQGGTAVAVVILVFAAACVTPGPSPAFEPPTSWAAMKASADASGGPGTEGYMWAAGSGPAEDQCGVSRAYSCFAVVHGVNRQFPCPCDSPMPESFMRN
jgi:hypothetical protein